MTAREIAALFEDLELRLIASLKRNLARHKAEEKDEGFDWPAWQAEKLHSLQRFRRENKSIMAEYSDQIDAETRALMRRQFAEADGSAGAFFGVNARKLDALIDGIAHSEARVERAALRYMDDVYRKTILRAAAALDAGGMTVQQATDLATKDFLAQGINCVRYKNGRMVNIASYAEMALRTNSTRAMLLGEAQLRERMNIDTVLVSQYGGCSETCLPWQGLVYIDDVWQPYRGGGRNFGGTYGYSRNGRSYPLLSVAVRAGLFHPNCRHHLTTWVEGVSVRPEPMDGAAVERTARLEARQRELERRVRKYKRLAGGTLEPEKAAGYRRAVRAAQKDVREFVDEHGDVLRRDYWRERYDGTEQTEVFARGSGGNAGQKGESVHQFLGGIDPSDTQVKEALARAFCKKYAYSPVENMLVITRDGEVHFMTDNSPKGVDCSYLGDKLKGSWNIHTHSPGSTQFSFSTDVDMPAFFEDGSAVMEAVDYKYRYRFERPEGITWEMWDKARAEAGERLQDILEIRCKPDYSDYEDLRQHCLIEETCRILGINCYTRWER